MQPSYQVKPQYPFNAQRRNLKGKVELEFMVGSDGRVKASSIKVLAAEPALIFEQAARRAVQNWRFPIKYQQQRSVSFITRQLIEFNLHEQ
ncbi:energy transducer TonB [Agarivorans sp. QJM3NY_25]|uniref:energy transducer TonB n=1 Tax=Agarivorans sp. QJM3NY_25 TaxID=3421430 RepID=UPI003D7C3DB2